MSTSTTTLWEVIKDYNNYEPKSIPEMVENGRKYIFDFYYDTPSKINSEVFKEWFETTFITNFALWEIGFDTYEQFHLKLWGTCSKIMPAYSKEFDTLLSLVPKHFFTGQFGTIKRSGTSTSDGLTTNNSTRNSDNNSNSKNMGSTLPVNMINSSAISDVDYATDSGMNESTSKTKDTVTDKGTSTNTNKNNNTDTYDLISSVSMQNLVKYNKEIEKLYKRLFNEFNYLFLGVL